MRRVIVLLLLVIGGGLVLGSASFAVATARQPARFISFEKGGLLAGATSIDRFAGNPAPPLLIREISSETVLVQSESSPHFPLRCLKCHASQGDCALCHADDLPGGAHPVLLSCASCHQPPTRAGQGRLSWIAVRIDHSSPQFSDCQACHASTAPANHYQAQCSACHTPPLAGSPGGWSGVVLDHAVAALTDCQTCHASNAPPNHFQAQCSACHTPPVAGSAGTWSSVHMDHRAAGLTDCVSCHANTRPANHFSGQCSSCHNTSAWRGASFNHQGARDCQGCHNPPRNHYGNNCRQCHTPGKTWTNVSFRWHKFDMDHGGANGDCSTCHTRKGMNCTSCHESEGGEDGGDD